MGLTATMSPKLSTAFQLLCLWMVSLLIIVPSPSDAVLRKNRRGYITKCTFQTGDSAKDESPKLFYVLTSDRAMFENAVKPVGGGSDNLAIVCETVYEPQEMCRLCIYYELTKKHIIHGQVINVPVDKCMDGIFDDSTRLRDSEYHPMCSPARAVPKEDNVLNVLA